MRMGRATALSALWAAVSGRRRPGSPAVARLLVALPRMAAATLSGRYDGLTRGRLGLMVLAALYVVSPVDLVPEGALLVVGLADDAMVLAWLAGAVLSETETFLAWEQQRATAGRRHAGERVVPGHVV